MGTRRMVVSFIRPVVASRTRCVVFVGISAQMLKTRRMPIAISRERTVVNIASSTR